MSLVIQDNGPIKKSDAVVKNSEAWPVARILAM